MALTVLQPIYVLLDVPFGVIGALLGHLIMDLTPNFLSVFGMLALAGVVVNDSLVLADFVYRMRRAGMPLLLADEIGRPLRKMLGFHSDNS